MDEINIIIRSAEPGDKNFILSTWLKGQYFGNPYFKEIPQDLYFKKYSEVISQILFTPGVMANVACDQANPSWIAGFCVFAENVLYWIHIKKGFRRKGIGHLLLQGQEIKTVKALTKVGRSIAQKKGFIFDPF